MCCSRNASSTSDRQGKLYAVLFGPDVVPGIVAIDEFPLLTDGARLADSTPPSVKWQESGRPSLSAVR